MRQAAKILAATAMIAAILGACVSAAVFSLPRLLGLQLGQIGVFPDEANRAQALNLSMLPSTHFRCSVIDLSPPRGEKGANCRVVPLRSTEKDKAIVALDGIGSSFDQPVLAPIGHVRFCLRYPDDCRPRKFDLQHRRIALTAKRWNELNRINREVNQDIIPDPRMDAATAEWKIAPLSGNCHDYAVTKRHDLLALGWPSPALLLAEVVVASGEHHLILVVRAKNADLVLDNLNANIRMAAMTRYQYRWVRIESPYNPKFWLSVNAPGGGRTAMISNAQQLNGQRPAFALRDRNTEHGGSDQARSDS